MASNEDTHIQLTALKYIHDNPELTQRRLASILGVSLGKSHYLINELIKKGWVKLKNFKNSQKKVRYLYILTPKGLKNKTRLTREFLYYKLEQFERIKKEIENLRKETDR
jgi:MarR family transcriptional regulator, temperature-dependent positive regulator of motility